MRRPELSASAPDLIHSATSRAHTAIHLHSLVAAFALASWSLVAKSEAGRVVERLFEDTPVAVEFSRKLREAEAEEAA